MPDGELELSGRSAQGLAYVADEMSEIFARAGEERPEPGLRPPESGLRPGLQLREPDLQLSEPGLRLPDVGTPMQHRDTRGPSAIVMGAVVFAALIGFGAGSLLNRPHPAPVLPEPATANLPEPQAPGPATAPAPPPIAVAQAAAEPARDPAPVAAQPAAKPSAVAEKAAVRPRTNSRLRHPYTKAAGAKPPIRLPIPTAQTRSCSQDAAGDECRRAVVQADRHLRAVYETAIRRGVPHATLIDYRDRWSELRDSETDNPTRLIQSYGALAYDLGRESAHQDDQPDSPRRRGRSSVDAQADLPLPWR
jgi:hypothetical protein